MIKNIFYSIFLHSLLMLTFIVSFKKQSITESYNQQFSVGFSNSISASELSSIKLSQLNKTMNKVDESKTEPNKDNLLASLKNKEAENKSSLKQIAKEENINNSNSSVTDKILDINKTVNTEKSQTIDQNNSEEAINNSIKQEIKINKNQVENLLNNIPSNIKSLEGSSLSFKEKTNILSQLKMCYKRAISETKQNSKLSLVINVRINRDGYIESDLNRLIDKARYNNVEHAEYKKLIDNVKKALDLCSPLRNLPNEKYEVWKELILHFDPE